MRIAVLVTSLWLLGGLPGIAQSPEPAVEDPGGVIDVPPDSRLVESFDALWNEYRQLDDAGDADGAEGVFEEIRRFRVERNIRRLESLGLAFVARGHEKLQAGETEQARQCFEKAIQLDPNLPGAYFGLAKIGGVASRVRYTLAGLTARLSTLLGRHEFWSVAIAVGLGAAFIATFVFAVTLLARYGALLRHDLEEAFGAKALGIYLLLLLLPTVILQGYGWLPLWWLALLFVYASRVERVLSVLVLALLVAAGPLLSGLEPDLLARQNPLLRASLHAVSLGPDSRALADLEAAAAAHPEDRDFLYLVGREYKKAGRYDDAAKLYTRLLESRPDDSIAQNNLANLEFVRGNFDAALARYGEGAEAAGDRERRATFYYNLSLTHLQRFEYEPAEVARSEADGLAGHLTQRYDALWKYEADGTAVPAVVDLGLGERQVWTKFQGTREGPGAENVAERGAGGGQLAGFGPGLVSRFSAFPLVFFLVILGVSRWRGARAFTLRCLKCGTPFCRLCQLGSSSAGLCTQCHHLFIVKDGVSAPARNQKMQEVYREESRRSRVFRILSLLAPGSGHLYAQKPVSGVVLLSLWAGVLATIALVGPLGPLTEAASTSVRSGVLGFGVLVLVVVYLVANLSKPSFDVVIARPRRPAHAGRR